MKSLFARGAPEVLRGGELKYVGMPIGGIGACQLHLGGDGRLWHWDIFNKALPRPNPDDAHYRSPLMPESPLEQGFAVRIKADGRALTRKLRAGEWSDVTFRGEYPVGVVQFAHAAIPVRVTMQSFSPFIPLNTDDSSLPATIFEFTLTNHGEQDAEAELCGWLENAIGQRSAARPGMTPRCRSGFWIAPC